MSCQRAAASSAASALGVSATLMASWRAEPSAYASIILDRQPAAAAERPPAERTISTITPTRATAPRRIHSHSRLVAAPLLAAGEPVGCAVTDGAATADETAGVGPGGVAAGVGGVAVGLGVVAVGLGVVAVGVAVVLAMAP